MLEIELDRHIILLDNEDLELFNKYKWRIFHTGNKHYIVTYIYNENLYRHKTIHLHRLIMNCPNKLQIDHINGNGLDNRKCNLRICNISQNLMNSIKRKGTTSKYKGVYWNKTNKFWHVQIKVEGERIHLGYFINEKDAACMYDRAAEHYFGEFARFNFPEENERGIN